MMTLPEAEAYLADDIEPDGGLFSLGRYLAFTPRCDEITLDGRFTLQDLQAIVVYMEGHRNG